MGNRGRPRQFDRDAALEAAMRVFWRKGYDAASCDELLAAMGINCGSMYSAFGDKEALFTKAFELYCEVAAQKVREILDGPHTPLGNLRAMVGFWAEKLFGGDRVGCMIAVTLLEFGPTDSPVVRAARAACERTRSAIEAKLRAARDAGELAAGQDPAELAALLVNTANGLTVMARGGADPATLRGVISATLKILSG